MNEDKKTKNPYLENVSDIEVSKPLTNEEELAQKIKSFAQNNNSDENENNLSSIFKQALEKDDK